jgi:hypothetical protein
MQLRTDANLTRLSRLEALDVWKKRNRLSFAEMGRRMGVTGENVSKLCAQDTMPVHRHEQLCALGVPAHLLPTPLNLKPGPKPRTVHEEFQAAFRG